MIIFIFALPSFALDLTQLQIQNLNHTALFKTQLQIDNSKEPPAYPIPQDSDQTRMNQILYEQEEKAHPKIIRIHDTPPPSPYKPKYEIIPDEDKPQTNAKLPRKKLQEEALPGEPILDVFSIAPIAQKHKVALLILLILILCVFILMRETYTHWLHKIFRKALWKISLETLYSTFVLIVFIALYYNNYFDFWLLSSQYKQDKGKEDILLIEIHDYDESYKYNIYAYLLIAALIVILLYIIHSILICIFDSQMKSWKSLESGWEKRHQILEIYKETKDEQLLKKTQECMDYLLIKTQFLSQMTPYLGPKILSDTFDLSSYLGHVAAETIYKISLWDRYQCFIFTTYFFLLITLLYIFNIVIVSIFCSLVLFIYIINLNYTLTIIKEKSMIKRDYDLLIQEELQVVPPFMEPIFENILPKRPVDIQSDLFPFGNKNYIIIVLSALLKISTTLIFIINVYFYYWSHFKWYTNLICNLICTLTWLSIIYISCGIIQQFTLTHSISIRNYEFVYQIIASQKQTLIEACGSIFEFARFIRKTSLQHVLEKDNLLLLRPIMVDIIAVCKSYQKKGMQQVKFDPREIELVDLGIESMDLIHKKHLKIIINELTDRFTEQDMVYISSFCSDENPDYFSPIKLILYLHLRQQEIKISDRQIIKDVLQQIIPMQYDGVQQFEGDAPDDYINQGLEGDVDLTILDNFLKEAVKSNYYKDSHRLVLLQQLQRLKSKKVDIICDFICDQISQLPI